MDERERLGLEIDGLRLINRGLMLYQSYDKRPNNRRNLSGYLDWTGDVVKWRERLIHVTEGPPISINANLIYLQGKIEQLIT
jgi:hypothetical protein